MIKLPILLFAGTDFDKNDPLLEQNGVEYKATLEIYNGRSIITQMLIELDKAESISSIWIVGIPENLVEIPSEIKTPIHFIETKSLKVPGRLEESCKYVLKRSESDNTIFIGDHKKVLFLGADVPFISGKIIDTFVEKFDPTKNLHLSVVTEETMNKRFPGSNRTYAKMRDGTFCMGDLSSFDASKVEDRMDIITKLRENRKNFIKVVLRLRPSLVLRFIFKRLTVDYARETLDKIIKMKTQIIEMPFAEIAFDVDKEFQLVIARKEFQ